ncbi:TonB-dependent receptor [Roseateles sp. YR242]|uniref:TonB-dependent receptor n=1 Tax=Roseateles sp. YR242 TaxID=1855305 RepID=UPI0008C3BDCF|nr:TonB-dependent receptor [Roseateles sp. YR242]SEL37621.1 TonB-dependent receptor [Roseateles sp. YR242]
MRTLQRTAVSIAAAQAALLIGGLVFGQIAAAQTAPTPDAPDGKKEVPTKVETVIVTGKRAALSSAQRIKQNADEVVDSIVADDIGKLPDRSVTEVLARIVGVTMDRTMSKDDPEHFSVEGSGITIRGLTFVRSEMNGRDSFSANGGRSLNFEDVPPELMAAVDVYKNPSAEQIEGGIGGLVNLRTALPFDFSGFKTALSVQSTYSELKKKSSPSISGLVSNRWNTDLGQFGALLHLASSKSGTRTDAFQVEPYYPLANAVDGQAAGTYLWVPKGSAWRTLEFERQRDGLYGALQWKNDSVESSITYFKSKYKMQWDERAIFAQSDPYKIRVRDGVFADNGQFLSGTLYNSDGSGINFGSDTRSAWRKSDTQDLGWKISWQPNNRWQLNSDLQYIRANSSAFDSTVGLGVLMESETIDLRGGRPSLTFSDADRAALQDPANYYWAFTQEHQDKSKATEKAWKGDAKFRFEDGVLQDLRFGVRLSERDATTINTTPKYFWSPISQPWQLGWDIGQLAYLNDPRFNSNHYVYNFNNFFGGKSSVPSLIFPTLNTATGYPDSYAALHAYHDTLCAEQHGGDSSSCTPWAPAPFGTDPAGTNDQSEKTQAAYAQLRFAFDDTLGVPVDGNVGLRVVRTKMDARGYTTFTSSQVPVGAVGEVVPVIPNFAVGNTFSQTYTNSLPSLNLRFKATEQVQFRAALSKAISRPDFSQLQATTQLAQNFTSTTVGNVTTISNVTRTGTADGNPMLKPIRATQGDLTAEWYFSKTGSLTFAAFHKDLKDVIINQTTITQVPDASGTLQNFTVTSPINGAKGKVNGIELAFQTYFDSLPGWLSGFGVQANYTYVDSSTKLYNPVSSTYCAGSNSAANLNLNLNGCDTNGQTFGNLPLANLSKNSYNLALLYDRGPISARLAYSWRSKYLQAVNVNGTNGGDGLDTNPSSPTYGGTSVGWALPTWADAYGQLDAGVYYKWSDNVTVGLEGQNLTDSTYKQLMQQHIGMLGRAWFNTGRRYTLTARMSF